MKNSKLLRVFIALLFWIGVWQWGAWLLSKNVQWSALLLPFPIDVLKRLFELMGTGHFWLTAICSLGRVFAAFAAGAVIGSVFAVLCAVSPLLSAIISPAMTVIRATPIASFIILLILWVGRDILPSIIVVLMALPVVWSNLSAGIATTDRQLLQMAKGFQKMD